MCLWDTADFLTTNFPNPCITSATSHCPCCTEWWQVYISSSLCLVLSCDSLIQSSLIFKKKKKVEEPISLERNRPERTFTAKTNMIQLRNLLQWTVSVFRICDSILSNKFHQPQFNKVVLFTSDAESTRPEPGLYFYPLALQLYFIILSLKASVYCGFILLLILFANPTSSSVLTLVLIYSM